MRLEGKRALVTGAGSGFGAGIAQVFSEEGARVFIADIDMDKATAVAKQFGGTAL
ncbi:MAG: SDR family NAD(P)-dependent oxidoreductase, partial [Pseudomonadota bacterium]